MKRWMHALSLAFALAACGLASACPMCKDSIPNGESAMQAGSLPGGFNTSVYFLLIGLFATIGLMTLGIVRGVRSTNQRVLNSGVTGQQNSRGFEVRPSGSS